MISYAVLEKKLKSNQIETKMSPQLVIIITSYYYNLFSYRILIWYESEIQHILYYNVWLNEWMNEWNNFLFHYLIACPKGLHDSKWMVRTALIHTLTHSLSYWAPNAMLFNVLDATISLYLESLNLKVP